MRVFAAVLVLPTLIEGCTSVPGLRPDAEFPRVAVLYRIKCELVQAVVSLAGAQSRTPFQATLKAFPITDYTASITLTEQANSDVTAQIGGFRQDDAGARYHQSAFGSGQYPGLAYQNNAMQHVESKRAIKFGDIVELVSKRPVIYKVRESEFTSRCADEMPLDRNPTPHHLQVGNKLGIYDKLVPLLYEAAKSPGSVSEEQISFDFTTEYDAAGTFRFVDVFSQGEFGAGGKSRLNEALKIDIVPNGAADT